MEAMTEAEAMTEDNKNYWKAQNLKRGHLAVLRHLMKKFRDIRAIKNFTNDDQMLEYLLDIERTAREQDVIIEAKACAQCGAPINVELDSYEGITHHHIDNKSDCFGCIKTRHQLKTKTEVPSGSTITKIGREMQVEQKDRAIQPKEKIREIDKDSGWKSMD